MKSICNFLPPKKGNANIEVYRFVYETEVHKLRQPFLYTNYMCAVAVSGQATLSVGCNSFALKAGTVFFAFPEVKFEIIGYDSFSYVYLTFNCEGSMEILDQLGISSDSPTVENVSGLPDHLMSCVSSVTGSNAPFLAESALYYAFAKISDKRSAIEGHGAKGRIEEVMEYLNRNFPDPGLSLSEISKICFYSEKHLSKLIKKHTGTTFSEYITSLRINKAVALMHSGNTNISYIATVSGFSDPLYFSRVFKKYSGKSPRRYISEINLDPKEELFRRYVYPEN